MGSSTSVRLAVLGAFASAALVATLPAAVAAPPEAPVRGAGAPGAIKDSYIVVLKEDTLRAQQVDATASELAAKYGARRKLTYTASIRGFSATMPEQQAKRLAADPKVAYVEQDGVAHGFGEQANPPSWGLDRVDQQSLPLDKKYAYPNDGSGATVYVVDSGVTSHPDFSGRLTSGRDFIDNDNDASDCNGHGTHVAGTVGGTSHGVAKKVKLVAVRVLGCDNSGAWSAVIGGFDWVAQNAGANSVATASLGGSANTSVDDAVNRVLAKGITTTLAAGNSGQDACGTSPARVSGAITVGASDDQDRRATFPNGSLSNHGSCLDLFAPGNYIVSTSKNGGSQTMSGTSMATPHVAGAAAILLTAKPGSSPAQVSSAITGAAVTGKITNPGSGSPNKLLNVTGLAGGPQPGECTAPANTTPLSIPDAGAAVESPITVSGCTGNASATTSVKVDITHPYTADLAIDLVAPDGSVYSLKKPGGVGESGGVHATYTADASSEAKNGTWKLRVTDVYRYDSGSLTSWSLAL
ncbi:S8 family peptidase [Lentzea flava]|uniref:Serine protease n=1 Tax=Lentzea flava TaxID=103732 RepID=A0ABQ2UAQ2_9PSEU|nr:S8 family peptidase [Lentzea flava]MCP2196546.1 Serine protease, subtilisin family [Lentzea flava]GGU17201.1 serine protease [Lentzea flava]